MTPCYANPRVTLNWKDKVFKKDTFRTNIREGDWPQIVRIKYVCIQVCAYVRTYLFFCAWSALAACLSWLESILSPFIGSGVFGIRYNFFPVIQPQPDQPRVETLEIRKVKESANVDSSRGIKTCVGCVGGKTARAFPLLSIFCRLDMNWSIIANGYSLPDC